MYKKFNANIVVFYKKEGLMYNRSIKMREESRSSILEKMSAIIKDEDFENIQINVRRAD